jgi:serine/threonine-protein kinase
MPVAFYKPNDTIEGLRVLQEVGQGAASTVYLAQDTKTKQIWAVKHVHRATEKDDRFLDQAVQEYEIARQLNHPNLRQITKCHKVRQKLLTLTDVFLVMEFTDGVSMEKHPPKTYEAAVEIFLQTAEAMKHMHDKGYVHADMKPNNIMLSPGPTVKIIDLGQSCKAGVVKPRIQGTPDYIAPEQVMRKPITPLTDIYNLGATMYWTITKRTVPTAMNQKNENSLMDRMDPSMVPKPRHVSELDPRCHAELAKLIMHCVEFEADDRPQSMQYVVDRLELILGILRAKAQQSAASGKRGSDDSNLLLDPSDGEVALRLDSNRSGSTSIVSLPLRPEEE